MENQKNGFNDKGFGGEDLMDLSKAFDTLNYELLAAKFSAYGFNDESFRLIQSCPTDRRQREDKLKLQ